MAAILFVTDLSAPRAPTGLPLPLASLAFYHTGTTRLADVWSADDLMVLLANPVMADADGVWPEIWLDPDVTYRVVLNDSAGVLQYDVDPYLPYEAGAFLYLDAIVQGLDGAAVVPGGTLTVTVDDDPAELWADSGFEAALPNPVQADSGGRFPAIYVEDDVYEATLEDAAGDEVWTITFPPQSVNPLQDFSATVIDPGTFPADAVYQLNFIGAASPGLWEGIIIPNTVQTSGPYVLPDTAADDYEVMFHQLSGNPALVLSDGDPSSLDTWLDLDTPLGNGVLVHLESVFDGPKAAIIEVTIRQKADHLITRTENVSLSCPNAS